MKLRFVLFGLVAAVVPLVLGSHGTANLSSNIDSGLSDRLSSAGTLLRSYLASQQAARRDLLLKLSLLDALESPLEAAAKSGQPPAAASASDLRQAARVAAPKNPPEMVAVATAGGAQVAIGSSAPRAMAPSEVPLVTSTLRSGEPGTLITQFGLNLYQISAMPVGISEAVLLVGDRIGDPTAIRLRDEARISGVTFVGGEVAFGSSFDQDARQTYAAVSPRAGPTRSGVAHLGLPGLGFLDGVFPVFERRGAVESRAIDLGLSAKAVLTQSAQEQLAALGKMQLLALGLALGVLLLTFVFVPVIFGPIQRQARSLEAHLVRLKAEPKARLGRRGFTRPFVELALELDGLADAWMKQGAAAPREESREAAAPPPSPEPIRPLQRPLDLPLAAAPTGTEPEAAEGTPNAFPFQDDTYATQSGPHRRASGPLKAAETLLPSGTPVEIQGGSSPVVPLPPAAKPEAPPPRPAVAAAEARTVPETASVARAVVAAGPSAAASAVTAAAPASAPSPLESAIPADLLERSRELEAELLEPATDPEEEHLHEVFASFVETRRQCGENADGLTFEKFSAKLRKSRDQLIESHRAQSVRFQVYVKEGKAAVKAVPVR